MRSSRSRQGWATADRPSVEGLTPALTAGSHGRQALDLLRLKWRKDCRALGRREEVSLGGGVREEKKWTESGSAAHLFSVSLGINPN